MGANVYENNNGRLPIAPAYMSLACLEYLLAGRSPVYQLFLKVLVCETGAWVHECLSDKESDQLWQASRPVWQAIRDSGSQNWNGTPQS